MKPVYLEFCGINSFSQKAVIDFQKLLSGGVFGIFGDTGSGKSTILDCIHLALYGKIDRAVGSQNDCINDRLDEAYVIFDFEITYQGARRTYRVHRERKRKASGNKAHLYEKRGETWQAVAEGLQDVEAELGKIIGLSFDDFKKCIALPQGEFAGLVKSTNAERMRLVSRLFDLEKYGERLSKKVRAKCDLTQKEIEVLEGRLQENAEGREEILKQKKAQLDESVRTLAQAEKRVKELQEGYDKTSRAFEEKVRYDNLCKEVATLEEKQAYYLELQKKVEKLPFAKTLITNESARRAAREEKEKATAQAANATVAIQRAEQAKAAAELSLKEGAFDEKIWRLDEDIKVVRGAQADVKALQETQAKYTACKERYKSIVDDNRDFEKLIKETEKSLAALDKAGSLEEYLTTHFKGVLLRKEYAEVRTDLQALGEKYPIVQADVKNLIQKYALDEEGDFDLTVARAEYEKLESEKRLLTARYADLVGAQAAQAARVQQKEALKVEGTAYRAQIEELTLRVEDALKAGEEKTLLSQREGLRNAKAQAEKSIQDATQNYTKALAEREKQAGLLKVYEKQELSADEEINKLLASGVIATLSEAANLLTEIPDGEETAKKCQLFFATLTAKKQQQENFLQGEWQTLTQEMLTAQKKELEIEKAARDELMRGVAAIEQQLVRLQQLHEKCKELEKLLKEKKKEYDLWDEIRSLVKNNQFLDFIASEYLQEICVDASRTLLSLTSGRYFLTYEGEFRIGDNLNGGTLRAVKTLSGGETFLVSLSLALSLSSAICQKSMRPIEFFFLDEGFGTLDEKLIDTVMNVLGKLIGNHFAIGLISHVEELKLRIENKVLVTGATERESSRVKVIAY